MKPKHAAHYQTNLILGQSLVTVEAIVAELRERLARELGEIRWMDQTAILDHARRVLSQFEPILAEHLADTDLAGWIAGYQHVATQMPTWLQEQFRDSLYYRPPPPLPPRRFPAMFGDEPPSIRLPLIENAFQSLIDRNILRREDFDQLDDITKGQAFTIAGDLTEDTIGTIRDALYQDIQEGTSLRTFEERVAGALETSPIGPAHLENVYRTNVQAAFRDGREALASHPIVAAVFPYQEYIPIGDTRVREEHLALGKLGLDGTGVYRRDDPMWDYFTPPWDFMCRCAVNLLTVSKAASKGVKEAQEWQRTGEPPAVPEWRIQDIPFRPKPGFGARVGMRLPQRMSAEPGPKEGDRKPAVDGTDLILRRGRWQRAVGFGSGDIKPDNDPHQAFQDALRDLDSPRHAAIKALFDDVHLQLGLEAKSFSVIGDWAAEGKAEASIVTRYAGIHDAAELQYVLAWQGKLANQKGMLGFMEQEGPDCLWTVKTGWSLRESRNFLDQAAILSRSLMRADDHGTHIYVVDFGQELRTNVQELLRRGSAVAQPRSGTAIPVGEWTRRADARSRGLQQYDGIIRGYESHHLARAHYRRSGRTRLSSAAPQRQVPGSLTSWAFSLPSGIGGFTDV